MGQADARRTARRRLRPWRDRQRDRRRVLVQRWLRERLLVLTLSFLLVVPYPVAWFGGYVQALAVPPTIAGLVSPLPYTEGQGPTRIAPSATVTNPDGPGSFLGGFLLVTYGYAPFGSEVLFVEDQGPTSIEVAAGGPGFIVSYLGNEIGTIPSGGFGGGSVTNPLQVTFTTAFADNAAVTALLQAVTFEERNTTSPSTLARPLDVIIRDAEGEQNPPARVTFNVTALNDPPVLTVPGPLAGGDDVDIPVAPPIAVADEDVGPNPIQVTVTATNGRVRLTTTTGLTSISGNNSPSLTFQGSLSTVNVRLADLVYRSGPNANGPQTLTVVANDLGATGSGGPQTDTETITVTITAVNDPPVVTVPGAQTTVEDTDLPLPPIGVADPDAAAGSLEVTLAVLNGVLLVPATAGVTPTGAGTATVTLLGQLGPLNTALAGVTYRPTAGFSGADTLTVAANDLGNTGAGGPLTDTETVAITVQPGNDPPVVTVPGPQTTPEDVDLPVPGISVADPDVGASAIGVTLTVTNGVVLVPATPGVTIGGSGTASASLLGPLADVNAALAGVTYRPSPNYNGPDSLTVTANDQGNTGVGGPLTDTEAVTIAVTGVNDPPVLTVPGPLTTAEDTDLSAGISVADPDAGGGAIGMTLTVTNGVVLVPATPGVTVGGSGTASASLLGPLADVNAALAGVTYRPTPNYNGPDTLTVTANDQGNTGVGGPLTDTEAVTITVSAVNDAPVVTVPGPQATPEDTPLPIGGISVADVDVGSAQLLVSLSVANGTLTAAPTPGVTITGSGSAGVTLEGPLPGVNAALGTLTYVPALDYTGPDTLTVAANDLGNSGTGGPLSDTETVPLAVGAVNDAPTITTPGPQTTAEDTPRLINGVGVRVQDVDVGPSPVEAQLSVANGTLTLTTRTGLSFTVGDGVNDPAVTFRGTLTDVNAALATLTYTPNSNYTGPDSLSVLANDLGSTGTGGPLTTTATVAIVVTAVNDAPLVTVPGPLATPEDTPLPVGGVSLADVDVGGASLQVVLAVANGTLTLPTRAGLTFTVGDGVDDPTVTFQGALASVNAALASLTYRPSLDYTGPDTLTVAANDLGNSGTGGPLTDTETVPLAVGAVNDAPTITTPGPQTTAEDTPRLINGVGVRVQDVDVGPSPVEAQLSVANGTLTLTTRTGLSFTVGDGVEDATTTFRGTLTAVNAALATLTYRPSPDYNGPDLLLVVANDLGNTGTGGSRVATATVSIAVGGANDPPVVTVPGPRTTPEDTPLTVAGVSVADPDAGSAPLQVTVSVTNGVVSLGPTAGLTFDAGDGVDELTVTVRGPIQALNRALADLTYRPARDYTGPDTLTVAANDLGNSGTGGPLVDVEAVAITVGPVNDAPRIALPGPTPVAASGQPVVVDPTATVEDVDSPSFPGGTLTVEPATNGTASDRLAIRDQGAGTGQIGVSGGTVTFGGTPIGTVSGGTGTTPLVVALNAQATVPVVQALLRNVTFQNVSPTPSLAPRTLRVVLAEASGPASAPATKTVLLTAQADLAVSIEASGAAPFPEPVTYTVVVTNNGPLTAADVVLTVTVTGGRVSAAPVASRGSCTVGAETVTCRLGDVPVGERVTVTIVATPEAGGTLAARAAVTSATGDPAPNNSTATTQTRVEVGPAPTNDDDSREREERRKETEEQRQQRERTNRSGLDDYRTEGNVVEVDLAPASEQPSIVIATRDGLQRIVLTCLRVGESPPADGRFVPGCPTVQVGDYVEANGTKEHELLFFAEDVTVTRGGHRVR